jgi:hypothetical protein
MAVWLFQADLPVVFEAWRLPSPENATAAQQQISLKFSSIATACSVR